MVRPKKKNASGSPGAGRKKSVMSQDGFRCINIAKGIIARTKGGREDGGSNGTQKKRSRPHPEPEDRGVEHEPV